MDLLFLDEFGDFSQGVDAQGKTRTDHSSWRPVCGYGGILLPADRYLDFCTRFEKLRIIGLQMIRFARRARGPEGDAVTYEEWRALQARHRPRLYSKRHEIKGNEFFSGSYLNSPRVPGARKRNVYHRIHKYLSIIEDCGGQVFYWGIEKRAAAFARPGQRPRSLHLNLLPGVLRAAHAAARMRKSQVMLVFDHHGEDNETKARIAARQRREPVHALAQFQTRQEYALEIILQESYSDWLREPMHVLHSHWSPGIQGADWVCSLLGKLKSVELDPLRFASAETFARKIKPRLDDATCEASGIDGHGGPTDRQLRLDL